MIIKFNGNDNEFVCYRLSGNGVMFVHDCKEITDWLFDNANTQWYMGNDFPYDDHPKLNLYNPHKEDTFLIFSNDADALDFEKHFPVSGVKYRDLIGL